MANRKQDLCHFFGGGVFAVSKGLLGRSLRPAQSSDCGFWGQAYFGNSRPERLPALSPSGEAALGGGRQAERGEKNSQSQLLRLFESREPPPLSAIRFRAGRPLLVQTRVGSRAERLLSLFLEATQRITVGTVIVVIRVDPEIEAKTVGGGGLNRRCPEVSAEADVRQCTVSGIGAAVAEARSRGRVPAAAKERFLKKTTSAKKRQLLPLRR